MSGDIFGETDHTMGDKAEDTFWEERLSVCCYCVCQRLGQKADARKGEFGRIRERRFVIKSAFCVHVCNRLPNVR